MRFVSSLAALIAAAALTGPALAKIPPLGAEAKAKAAEAASKMAWTQKVGLYKQCLVVDRVVEGYRASAKAAGKDVPPPVPVPACSDPGAYVSQITPVADKPIEASEAHSPTGLAVSPPSTNATAAELKGGAK